MKLSLAAEAEAGLTVTIFGNFCPKIKASTLALWTHILDEFLPNPDF